MRGKLCVLAAVSALLCMSCGANEQKLDENLTIENVSPMGSVGGVIFDAVTDAPIGGGVDVTLIAGGEEPFTTTTDENGYFMVSEVPASGDVIVMVSAEGYFSAQITKSFVNAAGDFPVQNAILSIGPIGLIPANSSMTVRLFSEHGEPVEGVSLSATTAVKYMDMTNGNAYPIGKVTLDATSDAEGRAVFNNLPDYIGLGTMVGDHLNVKVPPIDMNGNGSYDYPGGSHVLYYGSTSNPERVLYLQSNYPSNLRVEYSNVAGLENPSAVPSTLPVNGPVHVLFNLPIDGSNLHVKLVDEFDTETVQTDKTVDGNYLTITFQQALAAGAKYHLRIHAVSSVGNNYYQRDFYSPLYTTPTEPLEITGMVRDTSIDPTNPDFVVYFNQPIGTGSGAMNQNLYGARCVLWFDVNIGTNVGVGNDPGEWGYDSCNIGANYGFRGDEGAIAMPGFYASGYTTRWRFTAPQVNGQPMSQDTKYYLIFSEISDQNYVVTTPSGQVARDFMAEEIP